MDYDELVAKVIDLLERDKRVPYRALKRRFDIDDDYIEDLKIDIIKAKKLAIDEDGEILVWQGGSDEAPEPISVPVQDQKSQPISYTPTYLTEKILTFRSALEGERKQVTVLFADIKDSTELIKDLDPEDAQKLLDPAIHIMMDAVHRFEGTVNQVLGDGIMALFGAPIAHEDHAARACYAALAMQKAMQPYADEVLRTHGITMQIRVGLNSGEVVVRTIGNDLHMDYSAVGPTTHLAARMEQIAPPGSVMLSSPTLRLVEGLVRVNERGPVPVKGMSESVDVYELTGASTVRRRLQAAVARGLTKFVGRDTEIEALNQARERAEGGNGQIIAAVGEAGVGKSRLTYEFIHSHRTQGWLILESASVSYGKATPYFPVIDLLKRYVHVEDGDDPRTIRAKVTGQILTLDELLQETIPALLSLLDAQPEDSPFLRLDPPQRRQQTFDALKRILLRESQVQPLLLVFEDLHWIDSETQSLLDSLVENLPTAQMLLLVNYRPEYQHAWGSKTYYTQLRLDPLPPTSAGEFLTALLGDDPSLEPLKKLLIERTEGNPFFLEESVRTMVETQVLVGEAGIYRLAQEFPTIQVPATVQAILAARIDRLPQAEKRLLQIAAVIGTEVQFPLLQTIAELSEDTLRRILTHLQAAEFLYETDLFPERVYTFKHALTQNVAYQSLLTSTRQQYHRQIAQALEEQFAEAAETQPELLAQHFTEAGQNEEAIGYWRKAGEKAVQHSANVEAIEHLTKGLELLKTLPDTSERTQQELDMIIVLGPALMATQGYGAPDVGRVYTRARQLCQQVEDSIQLFPVLAGLRRFYGMRGELQIAHELSETLLAVAQQTQKPKQLVEAHYSSGFTLLMQGLFVPAHEHLEHAIAIYGTHQDPSRSFVYGIDPVALSLGYNAWALWSLGYPKGALAKSHDALTFAHKLEHPFSLARVLFHVTEIYLLCGEMQTAQQLAETGIAICTEQGFALLEAAGMGLGGYALAMQGLEAEGIAQIRRGLEAWQSTGALLWQTNHLSLLAEACWIAGQNKEGLVALAEAFKLVDKNGERFYEAELHRLKGELVLQQSTDNAAEAETCFHQALAVAQSQQAKSWELRAATSLAKLWQSRGKRQDAYDLLAPVYNWFTEGFDTADLIDAKTLLDELK